VRKITLLINALLLRRCEEFGFMVIPFLNIMESLNNQPLLVRLDPVTQPLLFTLGANSHPLQVMLRANSQPLLVMLIPLRKLVVRSIILSSLVFYAREITLLICALLSQRCEECGPRLMDFVLLITL